MFDAQRALENWRAALSAEGRLSTEQVAELEAHLIDTIENIATAQLSDEEKFLIATQRLGHPAHLQDEYEKVTPWATWRVPMFWATVGVAWVLGAEAILDTGVPLGALVAARLNLPFLWLKAWTFFVYVGGPLIAFAAVAAWMRRFSAAHPASTKALFTTVVIAALLRAGSMPLQIFLNTRVWKSFDPSAARTFQAVWQSAVVVGLFLTGAVAAVVLVRFRELHKRGLQSN